MSQGNISWQALHANYIVFVVWVVVSILKKFFFKLKKMYTLSTELSSDSIDGQLPKKLNTMDMKCKYVYVA